MIVVQREVAIIGTDLDQIVTEPLLDFVCSSVHDVSCLASRALVVACHVREASNEGIVALLDLSIAGTNASFGIVDGRSGGDCSPTYARTGSLIGAPREYKCLRLSVASVNAVLGM